MAIILYFLASVIATQLSISELADVLVALTEVTKPYQLGVQLRVDLAELDSIKKNHLKDISRQKTEVIKYWLRNSPDASWTTLASAVERMGGHARLALRLREKEKRSEELSSTPQVKEVPKLSYKASTYVNPSSSRIIKLLNTCVQCNILLLGKMGHGKSTLGNRMLDDDGCFKINDQQCPRVLQCSRQHLSTRITYSRFMTTLGCLKVLVQSMHFLPLLQMCCI